jgi:phosphonopyruvate decarboxylase
MNEPEECLRLLGERGVALATGVPCSYLAGPIRLLERGGPIPYVPAVNEGSALAIAAGARLSGRRAVVFAQNSGFGNLINPLASLLLPYRVPVLVLLSMRGWPVAEDDEPQHRWMGRVTPQWLDSLGVPYATLTAGGRPLSAVLRELDPALEQGLPAFVLVGKGAIGPGTIGPGATANGAGAAGDRAAPADERASGGDGRPGRDDVVDALRAELRDEYVVSTTGFLSRAMFHRADRDRNFYMQGSMGHASGLALGAALANPDRRVVVLDGDGAALMHLGAMASIGHHAPANLVHIVFDNGAYVSTGGQAVVPADFAALARGCRYRRTLAVTTTAGLRPALRDALDGPGPTLLSVTGSGAGEVTARASSRIGLPEIAARFAAEFPALEPR